MKVNLRNVAGFLQRALSLKKTRNVGAVGRESNKFTITFNARRVLLEKTHGIWKGFRDGRFSLKKIWNPGAVGRVSYKFIVTVNARCSVPEKTQGIWGVGTVRILHEKTQRFFRGRREWHVNVQSKWSPGPFYMRKHNDFSAVGGSDMFFWQSKWKPGAFYTRKHNDFSAVGGGGRRGCILIRNRDGGRASRVCRTVSQENTRGHGQKCCSCHEKWTAPPRVRLRPSPQWHACPVYIEISYRTMSLQVTEPQCCACHMKWTPRSVLTPSRSVSTLSKMPRLSGFWHVRVRFRPPVLKGDLTLRVRFRPSGRVRFRPPAPLALWDALKLWDALALFKDRACLHFPMQWNLKYQIKEIAFWISDGMFSTYM